MEHSTSPELVHSDISSPRYTAAEKVCALILVTSSRTRADASQGKNRARDPDGEPQASKPRRPSSPVYTGPVLSPPTSPVQGARLLMNRRFPVRPNVTSPSSSPGVDGSSNSPCTPADPLLVYRPTGQPPLSIFDPVPAPSQQVVRTIGSTDSIADSMTKEFIYDPNDKTPPKRRMKVVADAVKSAIDGTAGPSSTSTARSQPVVQLEAPESRLQIERQRLCQRMQEQRGTRLRFETGDSSRSARLPAAPPASYKPTNATRLSSIEARIAANKAALDAALKSIDAVYDRNALATGKSPYTAEEDSDEEELDDGPAASFIKSDAQKCFEESRRLMILSEHTEPSSTRGDDARSQAGASSIYGLRQQNISALDVVEPAVWMGRSASRSCVYSPAPQPQNPFGDADAVGEAGPSRIAAGSFFPTEVFRSQPRPEDNLPASADGPSVPNAAGLYQHPSAMGTDPDPQPQPLPTPPAAAVTRAPSSSPVHLSPVQEVDSFRGLLQTSSNTPPPVPMPTESEKPASSTCYISKWCAISWYVLAWVIPPAFLVTALYNMATTRTCSEMPPDLFTAESRTLQSENGSGNLTMAWMSEHAIGFKVSAILNTTLKSSEPVPNNWSFLLDWSAVGEGLTANTEIQAEKVSAMPLPSFSELFVRSMGLLGLFAVIWYLVGFLLGCVSRCWHWREDENVFWTGNLLRWFDQGRSHAALIVAAILSAVVWATASRALLSMQV